MDELLQHFLNTAKDIVNPVDFIRLVTSICDSTKCDHISIASNWLTSLHNNQFFDDTSPWRVITDNGENYRRNLYWNDIIKMTEYSEDEERPTPIRHVVHDLKLDNDTVYLSIPMMRLPDKIIIETYRRTAISLRSHNHLIIDLRGNYGGGDSAWSVFLKMIMSNDLVTPLYFFYRSGGDVKPFCDFSEDNDAHIINKEYFELNGMYEKIDKSLFTDEFASPIVINEVIQKIRIVSSFPERFPSS